MTTTEASGATPARPGMLGTALESARQTLWMLRYRRVLWIVPLVLVLLFLFALVVSGRSRGSIDGAHLTCVLAWWGLGTVLVPWATLYLGVQAVHGELEDRTSQYLFLRPVRRVPLLLGKWLAVSLVSALIGCAGVVALFLGVGARPDLWSDGLDPSLVGTYALVLTMGAFAYAAAAALFAATFRRPLAWAAFFVVGIQMLAANLPVSAGMRRLTITDPLRRVLLDQLEPTRRLAQDLWPAERAEARELDDLPASLTLQAGSPLVDLITFVVVCLAFASWRYAATEYESRSRD